MKSHMRQPAVIVTSEQALSLDGVHQYYIAIEKHEWKIEVLLNLYSNLDIQQAIIFCNTKRRVDELERAMTEQDFVVASYHNKMDQ